MRKTFVLLFLFLQILSTGYTQRSFIDSLKQVINQNKQDIPEVNALIILSNITSFNDAVNYAEKGLLLAQKINYKKGEADCNFLLTLRYGNENSNRIKTIQHALDALNTYQQLKDKTGIASTCLLLQGNYREVEDYNNSLAYAFRGEKLAEINNIKGVYFFTGHRLAPLFLAEISQTYVLINQLDSALIYVQESIKQNELFSGTSWEFPIYLLAAIQTMKGDYSNALENYRNAVNLAKVQPDNMHDTLQIYSGMSTLFKKMNLLDSSICYAHIVQTGWRPEISEGKNLMEALNNIYEVYAIKGDKDSIIKYLKLNYSFRDSMFSAEKEKQIQQITFNDQLKQQQLLAEQIKNNSRLQAYLFTIGIIALLLISGLLIRHNSNNKKAKINIEKAYSELKSTQAQLIQSEKMASLGELTAGIAHEIQNPLNFVNNFSEINQEMIDELQAELRSGNVNEAITISNDIKDNSEKINHHGKRADAIVKGMLQHSRQTKGIKEPTDINALCDEYLRLSYHGLRAKDKNFNAEIKTDFDESIGKINIVPQDIGRVLLNLFNNSFYAVNEKKKLMANSYQPIAEVKTRNINNKVEIIVSDNGNGIPQNIVDKIFQPFFTTKPTGQGTGLGLSLSYDIIKAHGGEIRVETKEGEGTQFIIQLPKL